MVYGKRSSGKEHGTVYTKPIVVDLILGLVGYTKENDLRNVRFLEPSVGEGNFLLPAIQILIESAKKYQFDFSEAYRNLIAVELDSAKISVLKSNIDTLLKANGISIQNPYSIIHQSDFLQFDCPRIDVVVGNPPYVRYDNIPDNLKELYKQKYISFKYRADIYVPFIEQCLRCLEPEGKLAFVCADRWLKNQYGSVLRRIILNNYSFSYYITMQDIDAFEEEVIAYPSIFLLENIKGKKTKHYIADKLHPLDISAIKKTKNHLYFNEDGVLIFEDTPESHMSIEGQGFKIGIGVATGADKVFLNTNFNGLVEEEVLLPIITSKEVDKGQINWKGTQVINPFKGDTTSLINLDEYPKLKKYFNEKEELLRKRHVAHKNDGKWYKTIDRIYPSLVRKPKLLLPDITTQKHIYFDEGRFYPHHNFYHITHPNTDYLLCLGAILLSDYCLNQITGLGNTMSGGAYRWQAQTLRKLNIPEIDKISLEDRKKLKKAFINHDLEIANSITSKYC